MYYLTFNIILFDTGGLWGLAAPGQTPDRKFCNSQVTSHKPESDSRSRAGQARQAGREAAVAGSDALDAETRPSTQHSAGPMQPNIKGDLR